MVFKQMDPLIIESVKQHDATTLHLGTLFTCQKSPHVSPDARFHWTEGAHHWTVRTRDDPRCAADVLPLEARMIHTAGTSTAVWALGDHFICKSKSWVPGMQSEAETIAFAQQHLPAVTIPEVLAAWVDESWNRFFIIQRRVAGTTLDEAWPTLSTEQRRAIAAGVARHCALLAQHTSQTFTTVSGDAIVEDFIGSRPFESPEPSWKPHILPRWSLPEFQAFTAKFFPNGPADQPSIDEFVFYHADLGPTNVMVRDEQLHGLIDWESAAYYPRWWVALKPGISAGFYLHRDVATDRKEWARLLVEALGARGFLPPPGFEKYRGDDYRGRLEVPWL